jgi:hypothetical protein
MLEHCFPCAEFIRFKFEFVGIQMVSIEWVECRKEKRKKKERERREQQPNPVQNPLSSSRAFFFPPLPAWAAPRPSFPSNPAPLSFLSFPSARYAPSPFPSAFPAQAPLFLSTSARPAHRSDAPSSQRPIPPPLFSPRRPRLGTLGPPLCLAPAPHPGSRPSPLLSRSFAAEPMPRGVVAPDPISPRATVPAGILAPARARTPALACCP